jgi:hypothetical protein
LLGAVLGFEASLNPNAGRDAVKCSRVEVGVHKPTHITPVAHKAALDILSAHPINQAPVNGYLGRKEESTAAFLF